MLRMCCFLSFVYGTQNYAVIFLKITFLPVVSYLYSARVLISFVFSTYDVIA